MMPDDDSTVWTYDRFEVGSELGRVEVPLDEDRKDLWGTVYGREGGEESCFPQGMLVAAMMEGSLRSFGPRPAGNIHAMQGLEFTRIRPKFGDVVTVQLHVLAKEMRRERMWVTLGANVSIAGEPAMNGEITIIWAA